MTLAEGSRLGPYQIIGPIGAGGMATVYRAYHAAMDRTVAIKVLPPQLALDAAFRARFARETRTIANLEHRNILPVYDVGDADGVPYLVMRLVEGGTLADRIAHGSLSHGESAGIVAQIADALDYAHRQGIVHRDVKPANILLSRDGTALLSDFGIARLSDATQALTNDGMMIGTPHYMAPEQVQGRGADGRSDIYALGVVLFEALTGRRPFEADTPIAVAIKHLQEQLPTLSAIAPDVPQSYERVLEQATAKNPAERFAHASEFAAALRTSSQLATGEAGARPATDERPLTTRIFDRTTVEVPPPAPPAPAPAVPPPEQSERAGRQRSAGRAIAIGIALTLVGIIAAMALLRPTAALPDPLATKAPLARSTLATLPLAALPPAPQPGPTAETRAGLTVYGDALDTRAFTVLGDGVWAGTQGGLVRYGVDGKSQRWSVEDGLAFNRIMSLSVAPDGALWLGGQDDIQRVVPVADGIGAVRGFSARQGLTLGAIHSVLAAPDGTVYAGCEQGLLRLDGERWTPFPTPPPQAQDGGYDVRSVLVDRDGALWIGLANGLARWDGSAWHSYAGDQPVAGLYQHIDGTIWSMGKGGVARYNRDDDSFDPITLLDGEDTYSAMLPARDAAGHLLVLGTGTLIELLPSGEQARAVDVPQPLSDGALGATIVDALGRRWLGGTRGVQVFDGGAWQLIATPNGIGTGAVGAVTGGPNGALLLSGRYGGPLTYLFPGETPRFIIDGTTSTSAAATDTDATIWVATADVGLRSIVGTVKRDYGTSSGLPSNRALAVLPTSDSVWVGTDKGLARLERTSESIHGEGPFDGLIVGALLEAADGTIWAGAHAENGVGAGVLGHRAADGHWQVWRKGDLPDAEDPADVTALAADSAGGVWMLTWESGLYRWDGAAWQRFDAASGAPAGTLTAIVADGDGVLVADARQVGRLYRYEAGAWKTVATPGVSGAALALFAATDGTLWIGSDDGLFQVAR